MHGCANPFQSRRAVVGFGERGLPTPNLAHDDEIGAHGQGDLHQITSHENVTMGLENEFSCPVWAFAS